MSDKPRIPDSHLRAVLPELAAPPAKTPAEAPRTAPEGSASVIAAWNARNPIRATLERYGYQREDDSTYTRPGEGASGRDTRLLLNSRGVLCSYHHSSNDPASAVEHLHEPFDLYTLYEHGGDVKAAVRAAAQELGMSSAPREANAATIKGKGERPEKPKSSKEDDLELTDYRDIFLNDGLEDGKHRFYIHYQPADQWFEYQGGVYVPLADKTMMQRVDLCMQRHGHRNHRTGFTREIMAKVSYEESVGRREWDLGPFELNVRNGILDLETFALRPHDPSYFSVSQSGAEYHPRAVAHEWLAFLHEALPHEGDRRILQKFAGYCLTDDSRIQQALMLQGKAGTGKGTFTRVLDAVLGTLTTGMPMETLATDRFATSGLVGKRMCTLSEIDKGVDWRQFKRITGQDSIRIEQKNKDAYSLPLSVKFVLLTNNLPKLGQDATNDSITRRLLPIEFNVQPRRRDPTLTERLTRPRELAGVLNWMLEGLAALRGDNFEFGSVSNSLMDEMREEGNRVIPFLRDACTQDPSSEISVDDLYARFRQWAEDNGLSYIQPKPAFGREVPAALEALGWKGVEKVQNANKLKRYWKWVGIR